MSFPALLLICMISLHVLSVESVNTCNKLSGPVCDAEDEIPGTTRRLLLLSSGGAHGYKPFEFAKKEMEDFFGTTVKEILFIPFALKDHGKYLRSTRRRFFDVGLTYKLKGIHEEKSAIEAVRAAKAIYIGGGNTFRLLKSLYDHKLIEEIRKRMFQDNVPYMGSSAGTNVATISVNTTNDMPIVWPPTLQALRLVPFNINPHYIKPDPLSTHQGETRDDRIAEFLEVDEARTVLGMKEGCWLRVEGDRAMLGGPFGARLFKKNQEPVDIPSGTDVSFLLG